MVEEVVKQSSVNGDALAGVGIGIAAQLKGDSGYVVVGPNLGWRDVPFGDLVQAQLGKRVWVMNDLNAIAWGEVQFGAAAGERDALVVFVGSGIGSGLVLNGSLYGGASGVAGEIGHTKIVPLGQPCGCGGIGCLEAYCGGANLTRRLREWAEKDWPDLLEQVDGDIEKVHPGVVEKLVQAKNQRAIDLFHELAQQLGQVLANAVTLLNPAVLVLGGSVLTGCPSLLDWSRQAIRQMTLAVAYEKLKIVSTALGDDAGIIGAAARVFEENR